MQSYSFECLFPTHRFAQAMFTQAASTPNSTNMFAECDTLADAVAKGASLFAAWLQQEEGSAAPVFTVAPDMKERGAVPLGSAVGVVDAMIAYTQAEDKKKLRSELCECGARLSISGPNCCQKSGIKFNAADTARNESDSIDVSHEGLAKSHESMLRSAATVGQSVRASVNFIQGKPVCDDPSITTGGQQLTSSLTADVQDQEPYAIPAVVLTDVGEERNSALTLTGLQTYVINLVRRPDRRQVIQALCEDLQVQANFVEAVDGQVLRKFPGAKFVEQHAKRKVPPMKRGCKKKVLPMRRTLMGFCGGLRRYDATWINECGVKCSQSMRMAKHRATVRGGHELWGKISCNLSHQKALNCLMADLTCPYALILEDDATIPQGVSASDIRSRFARAMNKLNTSDPDWKLVYFGGYVSTEVSTAQRKAWKSVADNLLKEAHSVYQTHAYLIRRELVPIILAKLKGGGLSADGAFVSWQRANKGCYMFESPLLVQPRSGNDRTWADSDISHEGALFQAVARKRKRGKLYQFDPDPKS